jgi:hypothetical protein
VSRLEPLLVEVGTTYLVEVGTSNIFTNTAKRRNYIHDDDHVF